MTYHTKFDVDIANLIHSKVLQESSKRALVENINACDEVWAVSRGAAENLRSLGYEGECVIMQNGVDLPGQGQRGAGSRGHFRLGFARKRACFSVRRPDHVV